MIQPPDRRCCGNCAWYDEPEESVAACRPDGLYHTDTLDNVGAEWTACEYFKWRMGCNAFRDDLSEK